jgi:hypothetical protein
MLEFNSENHLYTWNGSPVPSVTQVIGTWTKIAIGRREYYYSPYTGDIVEPDVMEKASDWGIAVHQVVAIILSGDDIDETEAPPSSLTETLRGDSHARGWSRYQNYPGTARAFRYINHPMVHSCCHGNEKEGGERYVQKFRSQ